MQQHYGISDTEAISRRIEFFHEPMLPNSSVKDTITQHRKLHAKLNQARGYVIHEDEAATKYSSLRPAVID